MSHKKHRDDPESLKDTDNPMLELLGDAIERHNEEHPDKRITPHTIMKITGKTWAQLFTKQGGYPNNQERPLDLERAAILHFILKPYPGTTLLMSSREKEKEWLTENELTKIREEQNLPHQKEEDGTLEEAGERSEEKKTKKKRWVNPKKLLTYEKWDEIEAVWGMRKVYPDFWDNIYNPREKKNNEELKAVYDEIAHKYYGPEKARKSIVAHELLFKGDNTRPGDYETYVHAQDSIIQAIEQRLSENPMFKYTRYFYLSQPDPLALKNDRDNWFKAFALEASRLTLKHLYRCLVKFPNQCTFKVTTSSSFRHKVIIDDTYMLLEDYAILNNLIVPESICVLDIRKQNETIKVKKLVETVTNDRTFEDIDEKIITDGIDLAEDRIREELSIRSEVGEILKKSKNSSNSLARLRMALTRDVKMFRAMIQSMEDKKLAIETLEKDLT